MKSPCVLAINLKNAASALCLAPWLLREGMLFGVLVTRTSFRGVYAARLTPSEVVLVVRGIPAPYTSLFPENKRYSKLRLLSIHWFSDCRYPVNIVL